MDINIKIMQSSNPLLSVIIPMYNCAPVIVRCLDSIDYPESEILVVDDGSTDNGAQVVTDYAKSHPNVTLIQKENGGVSSARNLGIESAHGQYLMFIDADDYIVPGGLERVLQIAIENDVDVLKYYARYPKADAPQDTSSVADYPIHIRKIIGKANALQYYDLSDYVVWDGLYKRSLIINQNIRFKTDLHYHEDDEFMAEMYCESSLVYETDIPIYRYVQSSNQSAGKCKEIAQKRLESGLLAIYYRQNAIKERCPDMDFPLEKYKYMRFVAGYVWGMLKSNCSYKEYKKAIRQAKQTKCWPVKYKYNKIAGYNYTLKRLTKTFLYNHPLCAYIFKKIYY